MLTNAGLSDIHCLRKCPHCYNAILGKKMIETANQRTAYLYLLAVFMEVLSRLKGILRLYRRNGASDLTNSPVGQFQLGI